MRKSEEYGLYPKSNEGTIEGREVGEWQGQGPKTLLF